MLLFASALKYNTNLRNFYADGCGINDQQLIVLADGLQHNQSVIHLSVEDNDYSIHTAVELIRHLTSSSIRILTMNRELPKRLLQEAQQLTNRERLERRGSGYELIIDHCEALELRFSHNQTVRTTVPYQVSEELLRSKHAS